ncbi:MAG: ATP--guanido phosphotransferase, partial [Candidatus Latescibacterota bacterium]
MHIEDMIKQPASWLLASGEDSEIVLSSRVRLARNIENHRFTHHAKSEELKAILDDTHAVAALA